MTIKLEGLDEFVRKLNNLDRVHTQLRPPMSRATQRVQDELAKYPTKAAGAFSAMATPAQKRAYWAQVSAGLIRHQEGVGYRRGGDLGRRWQTKVIMLSNGIRGEVGNNTPYARYVQSASQQQPFHKASGWTTEKKALKKHERAIMADFARTIQRVLDK